MRKARSKTLTTKQREELKALVLPGTAGFQPALLATRERQQVPAGSRRSQDECPASEAQRPWALSLGHPRQGDCGGFLGRRPPRSTNVAVFV